MDLELCPLRHVDHHHLQRLGCILWNWKLCGKCDGEATCLDSLCPWSRKEVLKEFWKRYRNLTETYIPDFLAQKPSLESHEQLLTLVEKIKTARDIPRTQLIQRIFDNSCTLSTEGTSAADRAVAIDIAACILLSTGYNTCREIVDQTTDDGFTLPPWRDGTSVREFIDEAFPRIVHPYFDHQQDRTRPQQIRASLTALNLAMHANLHLKATADIRQHLMMDSEKGIVCVYDCTPVLKEILEATLDDPEVCILPRALVLEVMHTLYKILFPPDQQSENFLLVLVRKYGFDADLLHYELARYQREDDPVVDFSYFSTRLAEIYDELQNPTPRTRLENWFERKSGARHMLMATMIGVFIAVIIGILGLGISGFQAYVSYQQWKHPVKDA